MTRTESVGFDPMMVVVFAIVSMDVVLAVVELSDAVALEAVVVCEKLGHH